MNYLFLCIFVINLFTIVNAMDVPQTSSVMVITTDKQLIEVEKTIAQQSNLLMVLQEAGMRTPQSPIAIRVSKEELDFFCSHLTSSAQQLLADLSDANYSKLMDIAEILKCSIFYAELMEALMTEKKLVNSFAQNQLNDKAIIKPISEYFTQKKCIKKSTLNRKKPLIIPSPDGKYFIETISNNSGQDQLTLWSAQPLKQIKTFPDYGAAQFSPDSKHIIISPAFHANHNMLVPPLLYSIEHDTQRELMSNPRSCHQYSVLFHPEGHCFIQTLSDSNANKKHILTQLINGGELKAIPLEWGNARFCCFMPDGEHLLYLKGLQLIRCKIDNPALDQTLFDNCGQYKDITVIKSQPLLVSLSNMQKRTILRLAENPNNQDELIVEHIIELESPLNYSSDLAYNFEHNIMAYNSSNTTLQLIDNLGNKIAYHEFDDKKYHGVCQIHFNQTDSHLASLALRVDKRQNLMLSTITLWNMSKLSNVSDPRIPGIRIDQQHQIKHCFFTRAGNLLTRGIKTELWNMNGDKIATLGKNQEDCLPISGNSWLAVNIIEKYNTTLEWSSANTILSTKLYHVSIDEDKIAANVEKTKKSLSFQQALLLNTRHEHRKDKKPTILHPNMPDGRAFASLKETFKADKEYKFFAKNFKLKKHPFIPKNLPISQ